MQHTVQRLAIIKREQEEGRGVKGRDASYFISSLSRKS